MAFQWTKRAIERLTVLTLEGCDSHEIARQLGCTERTVRKMQWELELAPRRDVHRWTRKERATLRRMYATSRTDEIAKLLKVTREQIWREARELGLHKDIEVVRETARERSMRPDHGGRAHQFPKGHVPANKGTRRPGYAPGRMSETQFKKGNRTGAANLNWKPVGTIRPDDEGYLRIKVREPEPGEKPTGFGNQKIWPLLHRHTWEQHRGTVPPGHNIAFLDGNRANCDIANLECISRAEQMRRNTIHNRYPVDVKNAIMLLGAVKRRLRERINAEEHNDGPSQSPVRDAGDAEGPREAA
jgi:hypothetical protein